MTSPHKHAVQERRGKRSVSALLYAVSRADTKLKGVEDGGKVLKWGAIGVGGVFVAFFVLAVALAGGGGDTETPSIAEPPAAEAEAEPMPTPDETTEPTATPEPEQEVAVEPEPTATLESPASSETVSQRNAVAKAKSYLAYTAFSHGGLVAQLEYEQFSHADAVYGADNSGADWNEQSAKKAKSYMEYSAFSRGALIDQLKYEQFTQAQAEYGADAVGLR